MSRMWMAGAAVLCLAATCSFPPFEFEGEHVVVGTDLVDEVCAGTIERLDLGVEHIEEQLGLPATEERVPVAILDLADAWKRCSGAAACASSEGKETVVILSPGSLERAATHELVHARLGVRQSGSIALFSEGVAVALEPAICPPRSELPTADQVLVGNTGSRLSYAGYYMGGELVVWLLETYGHERVLKFLNTLQRPEALRRGSDPEFVRASYRSHFGRELDGDIDSHLRNAEQISPQSAGCVAAEAPRQAEQVHLQANLDCGSSRVQNDFMALNYAFVDWTLTVPDTEAFKRYRLLDKIPDDTWLSIKPCMCGLSDLAPTVHWNSNTAVGSSVELEAGAYMVRWRGRVNSDAELDIRIESYNDE